MSQPLFGCGNKLSLVLTTARYTIIKPIVAQCELTLMVNDEVLPILESQVNAKLEW
ncbi:hypothetical protein LAP9491_03187 [Lactiplantibacillus plantarum]|nr:hypothetical protein LAP9491_03187 [Lactiplantibacillus plantarum]